MAPKHISNQRTTVLTIDSIGESWIIDKGASIINNDTAIEVLATAPTSSITVLGLLRGGVVAVEIAADDVTVNIGAKGRVRGDDGFYAADDLTLVNRGSIVVDDYAINTDKSASVDNFGTIKADYGLSMQSGTFHNHKGANIESTSSGVDSSALAGDVFRIINDGRIQGNQQAFNGFIGNDMFTNNGTMIGVINMGGSADQFDNRKGTIDSAVNGGEGNDTFLTSRSADKFAELFDEGYDTVKSSAKYTLGANVEKLVLLGDRDVDGRGNGGVNTLVGSAGNNHLFALGGSDSLDGKGGKDTLTGGLTKQDTFVFSTSNGHDRITDFEDNIDNINLEGFKAITSYTDLINNHTKDTAAGLVIFAGNDQLTITNFTEAQLGAGEVFIL